MKNKKGQINSLVGVVGTLIIIALLVGTAFIVLQEFRDRRDIRDSSVTVYNETGAYANESNDKYILASEEGAKTDTFTLLNVWASQDGVYNITFNTTEVARLSVDDYGQVTNVSFINGTRSSDLRVSYTFLSGEGAWDGLNSTLEAVMTIPNLLGLIVIIIMVGLALAIVFNVIPGGRVSGA